MKKLFARAAALFAAVALPAAASAQSYYDDYYYDDYYSSSNDAAGWIVLVIFIVVGLISLVFMGFWLWMLIDAFTREFENKVLWIVLFFVFGGWTALFYFFMIKRKNVTSSGAATGAAGTGASMGAVADKANTMVDKAQETVAEKMPENGTVEKVNEVVDSAQDKAEDMMNKQG